jgi:uncharacterized protein (DUF2384 family)
MTDMKRNKSKTYNIVIPSGNMVNEPPATFLVTSTAALTSHHHYAFNKFLKLQEKVPFTLKEWASILHISERTLQRYAQNNTAFEGLYVERLQDMEELIQLGLQAFKNGQALYTWLTQTKQVYNYTLNFDSLTNSKGIQLVTQQIGRIVHNVYS